MVILCLFSGFSINPPTASGCRMERLSHVTVLCLGRRSYLATWASSAWTRPLKMLSLWGMATLIIHFFVSFPTFSLSLFHYTLISDICSSNATHWCFAGQNANKISCIIGKCTVNRLRRNKPAFELATHFPVDEKPRHGNSVFKIYLCLYWTNKTAGITVFGHSSTRCLLSYLCVCQTLLDRCCLRTPWPHC